MQLKSFDESKSLSFLKKDGILLKKYNKTWDKSSIVLKMI